MPTRAEVLAVAHLARLTFSADELDRIAFELRGILDHVDVLRAVAEEAAAMSATDRTPPPSADAAPLPAPTADSSLRADVPGADILGFPPSDLARTWRDGFFTVPRLRTQDGRTE